MYDTEEERIAAKKISRKKYYLKNKQTILKKSVEYQKEYYAKYPEKRKERDKRNYKTNNEKILLYARTYYYKNLDKVKKRQALYRAKKRDQTAKNMSTINILESLETKDIGKVDFN
tara:strand:- start:1133 stop:1480 length:348 start_codon:yes stop_codon:yes gene_type:complete